MYALAESLVMGIMFVSFYSCFQGMFCFIFLEMMPQSIKDIFGCNCLILHNLA